MNLFAGEFKCKLPWEAALLFMTRTPTFHASYEPTSTANQG